MQKFDDANEADNENGQGENENADADGLFAPVELVTGLVEPKVAC